jgi:hypothetical protein
VRSDRECDWRNGHFNSNPIGLDVVQHGFDVKAAMEPDPCARIQGSHDVEETQNVAGRRRDLHAV